MTQRGLTLRVPAAPSGDTGRAGQRELLGQKPACLEGTTLAPNVGTAPFLPGMAPKGDARPARYSRGDGVEAGDCSPPRIPRCKGGDTAIGEVQNSPRSISSRLLSQEGAAIAAVSKRQPRIPSDKHDLFPLVSE